MRTLIMIAAFYFLSPLHANTKTQLTYSVSGSGSYYPYYTHDPEQPGILPEVVTAILDTANIEGTNLLLPAKRTVLYLETGKIDFDLISPSWLNDQQRNDPRFIYSDAILSVDEYIVSTKKLSFEPKLKGAEVGTVRGYYYHDDIHFERIDFNSEKELLQALAKGRIDLAIIGDLPAIYWAKELNIPVYLNSVHSQGEMHMRLQAKHKKLLPVINQAIKTLHQQAFFKTITQRYVQSIPSAGALGH
ncbi:MULTISPECIES: substrate-binding periplasmic protein [Pseudoalteromonas]|uniref:Amino acid ABC transporter substrate-binding protein n=1 Tax=Pseudoalteromonas amylolytica TaxID=1859457 RepID=A0A1S1MRV4_9GAMM|nr:MULTISPECIES: transporter substrate-binding domain-containing protein [Pseudoalteromonas]OHU86316.1 amino acid ABC transporter substrate-binding protein [Pseudoalteromonas sp. JW3]OHU89579.1 amino acid ABC transporter substrate-binding protein [Pseudoalteromonas amylolytica]